jgi:hypothetical protein
MWHQRLRFTVLLCSGLVPELGLFAPFREFRNARFLSPPDWVTYGGALGVAPWNPSLHLQGAIGQFLRSGRPMKSLRIGERASARQWRRQRQELFVMCYSTLAAAIAVLTARGERRVGLPNV